MTAQAHEPSAKRSPPPHVESPGDGRCRRTMTKRRSARHARTSLGPRLFQPHTALAANTESIYTITQRNLRLIARLLLADFDPQVAGIWAQPCRIVRTVDGRQRRHVPDFLLASPTGEVSVVNVKPAHRLADPAIADALAWPGELLTRHGWRYEVWSGCDAVVLENVRFLAGYRRPGIVDENLIAQAWQEVRDGDALGEVERRLAGDGPGWTVRPALLALLWHGRLTTDLSRPLSGTRSCAGSHDHHSVGERGVQDGGDGAVADRYPPGP
jgi:hypothetical protein